MPRSSLCDADMKLLLLLLFTKVSIAWSSLYQPQEILYVEANHTAEISCRSRDPWWEDSVYSWYYRRTWGETPTLILSCLDNKTRNRYSCVYVDEYNSVLRIHSVRAEDSGTYHCEGHIMPAIAFRNFTALIVQDHSPPYTSFHVLAAPPNPFPDTSVHALAAPPIPFPDTSIHALDVSHTPLPDASVQLTCVVRGARHMLRVTWNISGILHTGRMITMEDPTGTRTFVNHISIPRNTWDRGEGLSCDVWTHSSPASIWREIPGSVDAPTGFLLTCSFTLRATLTGSLLLALVLSVHLSWTYVPLDRVTP